MDSSVSNTLAAALAVTTLAVSASACVRGNPESVGVAVFEGGTGDSGCGYPLVNRVGAEAPEPGSLLFGDNPTPRQVHLGIASDPRTSMAVIWRTGDEYTRAASIRYAQGADLPADQLTIGKEGVTYLFQGGFSSLEDEQVRMHEAHLCGLLPDTAYSYQVGGGTARSPVYTFRTAPDVAADPSAEVALAFVGDSRNGYDVWEQIVGEIADRTPDVILFSGDAVTFGQIQFEWDEFFERGEPLLARVPIVSAHGNHDVNAINYYAQLVMPGDEENFGLDYGFAHVTVLNDSPKDEAVLTGSTKQFLATDLAASQGARWKLVMHHRPQWSASANHGSNELLQAEWGPIIDQHQVDLVLAGHDHDYERSKPLRGGEVATSAAAGTTYVVSGGAGAELYEPGTGFWTEKSEKTHGAAIVRIRRDQLTMEAFRPDGSMIDSMTLTKP
jgi:hypothetical protein